MIVIIIIINSIIIIKLVHKIFNIGKITPVILRLLKQNLWNHLKII